MATTDNKTPARKPVLSPVNLTNLNYGVTRYQFVTDRHYHAMSSVLTNYRKLIHTLGFDATLLTDDEIMGMGDLIHDHEEGTDEGFFVEYLNFLAGV